VWHFTGRFTPQGNIGKYSDAAIEAWVEWDGAPGALIEAMVQSGWLQRTKEHRVIVHDWHEHADDATRLSLKRKKLGFVTLITAVSGQCRDSVATTSGLPEPEPVPEPEPGAGAVPEPPQAAEAPPLPAPMPR